MKKELARLVSAQVCLHSCMTGLRMAAPLMLLRAGESEAAIGVLLSLFALSQVFLALPAGQMADSDRVPVLRKRLPEGFCQGGRAREGCHY